MGGYVLVLLRPGPSVDAHDRWAEDHRKFVDSLIRRNLILLGGGLTGAADLQAAYVLRAAGAEEAAAVAADDPFVRHGVVEPVPLPWELVGINPEAIDPASVVTPAEV